MSEADSTSELPISPVLRLLLTRSDSVLRGASYRVKIVAPFVSAIFQARPDGWSLAPLPGNRLPLIGVGDHHAPISWDVGAIDVPWLEEMLNPGLILSSLHPLKATQESVNIALTAAPRENVFSGDCAAVVLPGCGEWRAVFDPASGTLLQAQSLGDAGAPLETTRLSWLDQPKTSDGTDSRLRTSGQTPAQADVWDAAFDSMSRALDGLRHRRWTADVSGYLTRAGLVAVSDEARHRRARGYRGTSNFSGGSEWRNPGWSPWLEFPDSPGAITQQVPFEHAWRGAEQLPADARHASYERITWDGQVWQAKMLGPNGEEFYTRTGSWSGSDGAWTDRRPTWAAMVPEMLDPYLVLGSLELRTVTRTGKGYRLRGLPRPKRLGPYPAVIHPNGDFWEGTIDAATGVLRSCSTRRNGRLLSSYHLRLSWMTARPDWAL